MNAKADHKSTGFPQSAQDKQAGQGMRICIFLRQHWMHSVGVNEKCVKFISDCKKCSYLQGKLCSAALTGLQCH